METVPIPEPPGLPFLGNIGDINSEYPLGSLVHLAETYGPIFRLRLPGKNIVVVSTNALVNEACNEQRFNKRVEAALKEIRWAVHDGLFTANPDEENWGIAHRVLMPAFGPMSIKDMFGDMQDIATQLAMKWARHGPNAPIMVTDDFTRLALDTISLCSMDYRFNSYYRDDMHPFIEAMGGFLKEAGTRSRRPKIAAMFYRQAEQQFFSDIDVLRKTALEVLEARKESHSDRKDLLSAMMNGVDPKTGKKISDSSIVDNLITFLIAGHETTSGLLSFAFYQLLKHPEAYRKAQQEVDEVVGTGAITVDHLGRLPYIMAILRETLRLSATIPAFAVTANEDQVMGGKYVVNKGEPVILLLAKAHKDPVVYGDDVDGFKPERMLEDNFNKLTKEFPNCWKPFGNGSRACIGRPFAIQESLLIMAILFQNFNFVMDDPNYQLEIKQTLTIKPKDFYMRAILREGLTPTMVEHRLAGTAVPASLKSAASSSLGLSKPSATAAKGKPMSIYYGSNSGTCESMAQRLASNAARHGFNATVVDALDAAKQNLPKSQPMVIITASYEGEPPDNAAHFVSWIKSCGGDKGGAAEFEGVPYAVFGCGHHDWAQTFHRIPKLVDATLEQLGGRRVVPLGLTDAATGDMFTDFETWEDSQLWPALADMYGVEAVDPDAAEQQAGGLSVEVSSPRSTRLRQDVKEAQVVAVRDLSRGGPSVKKHMEIQLPSGMTYQAGDYLAVLPLNPKESVARVMHHFQLAWDSHLTIAAEGRTILPTNVSVPAYDVFGAYVELAQPATKRNILALTDATKDEKTKQRLQSLATDSYAAEISAKRTSVLDLLEEYPAVELPLAAYLGMLPPMRVRQYSISSSPLWNPSRVTLTYAVLDTPALSAPSTRRHIGVSTSYLASLTAGDRLHVAVRASHAAFHLPRDGENVPLICVAAGTGLAPFRGFVQERAAMLGAGRALAPALLFYGCRDPQMDDLYRDELDRWEKMGAISVRRAYSRAPEKAEGGAAKYVQDALERDIREVGELWDRGAKVFVCGSRAVGDGVKQKAMEMSTKLAAEKGVVCDGEKTRAWFEKIRNERYATDVFD